MRLDLLKKGNVTGLVPCDFLQSFMRWILTVHSVFHVGLSACSFELFEPLDCSCKRRGVAFLEHFGVPRVHSLPLRQSRSRRPAPLSRSCTSIRFTPLCLDALCRLNSLKALAKYSIFAVILAPFGAAFLSASGIGAKNYWDGWTGNVMGSRHDGQSPSIKGESAPIPTVAWVCLGSRCMLFSPDVRRGVDPESTNGLAALARLRRSRFNPGVRAGEGLDNSDSRGVRDLCRVRLKRRRAA
jgi:hypothetical protein